jgi:hypothetical protein
MAAEEPGIKPVVLYVNGEAVSTLNPLPATGGGGGGGGGIVEQGVGSGLPSGAWTTPISASSLPLPTGAATETSLGSVVTELTTANANLTDIQTRSRYSTPPSRPLRSISSLYGCFDSRECISPHP